MAHSELSKLHRNCVSVNGQSLAVTSTSNARSMAGSLQQQKPLLVRSSGLFLFKLKFIFLVGNWNWKLAAAYGGKTNKTMKQKNE